MINLFSWFKRSKMKREIIINVEKLETRVAVLENGRLEEFMVEHPEDERLVGCVFKGRIQNLQRFAGGVHRHRAGEERVSPLLGHDAGCGRAPGR